MANQFTLKNGGYEPFIGNYGLVPQPPIPTPESTDNGKVLGVSEGQYALVSGGGGGSAEPLIVNVVYSEEYQMNILDKTAKAIRDAYYSGQLVIIHSETTDPRDGDAVNDESVVGSVERMEEGQLAEGAIATATMRYGYITRDDYPYQS